MWACRLHGGLSAWSVARFLKGDLPSFLRGIEGDPAAAWCGGRQVHPALIAKRESPCGPLRKRGALREVDGRVLCPVSISRNGADPERGPHRGASSRGRRDTPGRPARATPPGPPGRSWGDSRIDGGCPASACFCRIDRGCPASGAPWARWTPSWPSHARTPDATCATSSATTPLPETPLPQQRQRGPSSARRVRALISRREPRPRVPDNGGRREGGFVAAPGGLSQLHDHPATGIEKLAHAERRRKRHCGTYQPRPQS